MKRSALLPVDLYSVVLASDAQIAPCSSYVLFTRTWLDEAADEARSAIWIVREGETARPFTSGTKDGSPRIAPDGGTVAFVADRGEGKRIYLMPTSGGEARALTKAYDRISGVAWSRDSEKLAFVAMSEHDPKTARIAYDAKSGARHIRALPFKSDDDGLLDGRRQHLFAIDVGRGEERALTSGDFNAAMPAWSPAGDRIAFSAQIGQAEDSFVSDIYTVPAVGGEFTKVTRSRGPMGVPAFSGDGTRVACIGHERGDDIGGRFNSELFVVAAGGGEVRSLSAAADRSVGDFISTDTRAPFGMTPPQWSSDDCEIFVSLSADGACGIAAFPLAGGTHRLAAGGERDIPTFSLAPDGALAFVYSDHRTPSDVCLTTSAGEERRLTHLNEELLATRTIAEPRRLRPAAPDGTVLDVFLLEPLEREGPHPLILQVHGGPHMAYGCAFFFEFQMLASLGFAVAFGNPRGSQSYGERYAGAITGDWGGIDAADVLTMLDAVEAAGAIDRSRVGIAGGSYGGFMTTWLLGHSKRFVAGVSMRAVNDFVSEVGASDFGWFLEKEIGADWNDRGQKLFANSPMRSAHAIEAPLLIEHSERDYRCPVDQGEQLFTLLRRLGKTAEFVRFTGDGHNLSRTGKPRNRALRLRAIAHWFVRHLRPSGIEAQPDEAGALFRPLPGERSFAGEGAERPPP